MGGVTISNDEFKTQWNILLGVSEDKQQHFHEPGAGSEDIPTLRQGERHKAEDDITIYDLIF